MWYVYKAADSAYEVNEMAEVRRIGSTKILKKYLSQRHGRYYVTMTVRGKVYCRKLSRIVAESILPNPMGYSDVNHINGDKTDDRASNLEWCSRSANIQHAIFKGLRKRKTKSQEKNKVVRIYKTSKPVYMFDKQGNMIKMYKSATEAAVRNGFSPMNILNCCVGRKSVKTVGDYIFSYKNSI